MPVPPRDEDHIASLLGIPHRMRLCKGVCSLLTDPESKREGPGEDKDVQLVTVELYGIFLLFNAVYFDYMFSPLAALPALPHLLCIALKYILIIFYLFLS